MIGWHKNRPTVKPRAEYTIFQILRACRKAAGLEASNSEGQGSSKLRVLFVEDDADTRELVWYALTRANYEVQLAENPAQGVVLAMLEFFLIHDRQLDARCIWDRSLYQIEKARCTYAHSIFSGAASENDNVRRWLQARMGI